MTRDGVTLVLVGVAALLLSVAAVPAAGATASDDVKSDGDAANESFPATADNISTTLLVAPEGTASELTDADAIDTARADERLMPVPDARYNPVVRPERTPLIGWGDVYVHEIRLSGPERELLDRLAAQNGTTDTERFEQLRAEEGITVAYDAYGETPIPDIGASIEDEAFHVVADHEADTLYLVAETRDLAFERTPKRGAYTLEVHVDTPSGIVEENVTAQHHFLVMDRSVWFRSSTEGLLDRRALPAQEVAGSTNAAPGTELTLHLRPLAGGETITTNVTVNRYRWFWDSVNLHDVPTGVYAVESPALDDAPPTLLTVGDASGAVVTAADARTTDEHESIAVEGVTTDGGFVVVSDAEGEVVGVSAYQSPGRFDVDVELDDPVADTETLTATVYRDETNTETLENIDDPYRIDGSAVADTATLTVDSEDGDDTMGASAVDSSKTDVEPESSAVTTARSGFLPLPGSPLATGSGLAVAVALTLVTAVGVHRQ